MGEPQLSKADLEPLKALHRSITGAAPRGPKSKNPRWVYERIKRQAPDAAAKYIASRDASPAAADAGEPSAAAACNAPDGLASEGSTGLFAGAVVSTSQLHGAARTALFAFVLEHGGQCTSRLDARCTHLILREAAGTKYRFARHHKIHTVKPEFVA